MDIINEVNSNVLIKVNIITNGTLGYNDNAKIVDEFLKLGFEYDGEPITQDDGSCYWTLLQKNKGFILDEDDNTEY